MTDLELKRSLLSCPGDTIQEQINSVAMSQVELSERLGRSIPKLNELIKGKAPITKETATKLEYVLGVSANFWLNLERQYQDELLEIEQMEHLENCKDWVQGFPLLAMKKIGILPNTNNKPKLADGLLRYFRVGSPNEWSTIYEGSSLAFKIELRHTTEPQAISVWLRLGELQAEQVKLAPFDKKAIRSNLKRIQEISFSQSSHWMEDLQSLFASCGVALVYTPCIAKAPIYGATRWVKNNSSPLIQMTDRKKDYHAFWFTLYHELGHVLYHGKKDIFIDGIESIKPDEEKEKEANSFASRMLLSEKERNEIFQYPNYDSSLVISLSKKQKIHPSIIVSQLQREGIVQYNNISLNRLKTKVVFAPLSL